MKFSLVLATVNRTKERAFTRQTYRDFELIIVDQNLDDRLMPICRAYEENFQLHTFALKQDFLELRNVGLYHAKGEVVSVTGSLLRVQERPKAMAVAYGFVVIFAATVGVALVWTQELGGAVRAILLVNALSAFCLGLPGQVEEFTCSRVWLAIEGVLASITCPFSPRSPLARVAQILWLVCCLIPGQGSWFNWRWLQLAGRRGYLAFWA